MNVLLINGSPHKNGCTFTALSEVADQLNAQGIATHILHIGTKGVQGCIACKKCADSGRCVFDDDPVNEAVDRRPGDRLARVLRGPQRSVVRLSGSFVLHEKRPLRV